MDKLTTYSTTFHSFYPLFQNPSFRKHPNVITCHSHGVVADTPVDTQFSISDYDGETGKNKITSLSLVKQVHAHLLKQPKMGNYGEFVVDLMTKYLGECDFESAALVFFVGVRRNFVKWRWFFEEFRSFGGDPIEILRAFAELHRKDVKFGYEIYTVVLRICAILMEKWVGVEVHSCLVKRGLDLDVHLNCSLMNFYGRCWGTDYADKVFGEMPERDASLWKEVIVAAIQNDRHVKGLELFREMQFSLVKADSFTVAKVLQVCGKSRTLEEGRQIHGYVFRNDMEKDIAICNSLINLYSKNNKVEQARKIFDAMESRNLSSWNSMISCYASLGCFDEAMKLFHEMEARNVKPDLVTWACLLSSHSTYGLSHQVLMIFKGMVAMEAKPNLSSVTLTPVIQAIIELKLIKLGKEMHSFVLRNGLDFDSYVQTTLLDMYVKADELVKAQAVFDLMKSRNIVAFNSLIAGYSSKGLFDDAVKLLNQMKEEDIKPDIVTWNSLICGYSLNGHVKDALAIVDKMTNFCFKPNVISWTALISGSSQNGNYEESLKFFSQMLEQGLKPNSVTMTSLLQALAGMSWLQKGKEIHCWCVRNGTNDVSVMTALIQLYIKSGSLQSASDIFRKMKNKNLATWNCMIMGFAIHNHGKEGIMLFNQMCSMGFSPDAITFTALLSCCKNSGLLDEGWRYFDSMKANYNIVPTIKHYSCMIDLLGRAGYLDEAWDFIQTMPVKPDASVWGSLLRSCRAHDNLNLGEIAAKALFELEPYNSANYVIMMNLYSMSSRWEDVDRLREQMSAREVKYGVGWSWIQINHEVHVFSEEDQPHLEIGNIYYELYQLVSEMKEMGYIPDIKSVYQDIDDDDKEKVLLTHTEKLAITYGLMKSKDPSPIRVIKSTRMCSDCHIAAKYMSLARNRDIIVKDGVRFHHFREGKCSCNDCW